MNDIKITGALSNYILSQTLSYFNCILDKSTLVVSFSLLPAVFKSKVTSTSPFSSELSFNLMPLVSEGMSETVQVIGDSTRTTTSRQVIIVVIAEFQMDISIFAIQSIIFLRTHQADAVFIISRRWQVLHEKMFI